MQELIKQKTLDAIHLFASENNKPEIAFSIRDVLLNKTSPDFKGDFTVVIFPFVKKLGANPALLGEYIGQYLKNNLDEITGWNLIKGFLNLELSADYWKRSFVELSLEGEAIFSPKLKSEEAVLIEYPSPNTNKPLHLGHLRNIFLGASLSEIMKATGHPVIPVCLYNDRGTNICKSMVAWKRYAHGQTPKHAQMKGDHFVGHYYVKFNDAFKEEVAGLKSRGMTEEEAKKAAPIQKEVEEMLLKWEAGDSETRELWALMNGWVYEGFAATFNTLGVSFVKNYYESEVYNLGKETVEEGLSKGIFYKKEDGAIAIDLSDVGLDEKVVLRSNGTSIYITQDIAVAYQKQKDFDFTKSIYVVGNEQDYHFKVLIEICKRLGMKASDQLYHLSYGMVELPTGKMKSREGTVVDADDLIALMVEEAREKSEELGKTDDFTAEEKSQLHKMLAMGALKYFILKVDPKKKMIFNPAESIEMQGNTGPFVQYTYARIASMMRLSSGAGEFEKSDYLPNAKELELIKLLNEYKAIISEAAATYSPAVVANYVYELAKTFNQFYHDYGILKEPDAETRNFRLKLSKLCGLYIKHCLKLLGIEAPEKM
jgi:arginyl-tRNA synthetase